MVTATLFGSVLELDLANFADRMIYMGCYEPLNTYRFKKILRPGMVVVDVGANIGYFSLLAASCVGNSGRVFAIEPWPANFAVLKNAVQRNGLRQVSIFSYGLGATDSIGRVSQADQKIFNNRTASMAGDDAEGLAVVVKSLDQCLDAWGVERVDLLKVDVDGFETQVLAGAQSSLRSGRIRNIIIELNDFWLTRSNSSRANVCAMLEDAGFCDLTKHQYLAAVLLGPVDDRHFRLPA
jgi:FkbM family methyltransferase